MKMINNSLLRIGSCTIIAYVKSKEKEFRFSSTEILYFDNETIDNILKEYYGNDTVNNLLTCPCVLVFTVENKNKDIIYYTIVINNLQYNEEFNLYDGDYKKDIVELFSDSPDTKVNKFR